MPGMPSQKMPFGTGSLSIHFLKGRFWPQNGAAKSCYGFLPVRKKSVFEAHKIEFS